MLLPAKENGVATFEYKIIPITIGEVNTNSTIPINAKAKSTQPTKAPYSGQIYKVVEQMPRFPGCEDRGGDDSTKKDCADRKMLAYIYDKLKYPAIAKENGVEGTVVVQFVVEKDGAITNVKCIRDIAAQCGQEGVRVVKTMKDMQERWTAGRQRGKAVRVQFNLPIKFRIEDEKKEAVSEPSKVDMKDPFIYDYRPSEEKLYQSMIGEVHILSVFVDTQKDHWEEEEQEYYYGELLKSQNWLKTQAKRYKQQLEFNNEYFFRNKEVIYVQDADRGSTRHLLDKVMEEWNYQDFEDFTKKNSFDFGKQKLKVIFFVKSNSRSHAFNFWSNKEVDIAIIYCRSTYGMTTDQYVISHEMLHQFGAWDLYFGTSQSEEQAAKAKELYPNSVMISTRKNRSSLEVDALTAWRVGWHVDVRQEYLDLTPVRDSRREKNRRKSSKKSIKFNLKGKDKENN